MQLHEGMDGRRITATSIWVAGREGVSMRLVSVQCGKRECHTTSQGERAVPRLRELAPRGQGKSGGGIHAAKGPLFCPTLYSMKFETLKVRSP